MIDKDFEQFTPILKEIQERANKKFPNLFKEVQADPDVVKVIKEASELPNIPKWKKDYYEVMAREMDKTETVLDDDKVKEYNDFLYAEFKKARDKGLLK